MEAEQVFVRMGYDPKTEKFGLIFDFINQQRFCVNMTRLQLNKHIQELNNLIDWATKLPMDEKEWEKYPKVEAVATDLNEK